MKAGDRGRGNKDTEASTKGLNKSLMMNQLNWRTGAGASRDLTLFCFPSSELALAHIAALFTLHFLPFMGILGHFVHACPARAVAQMWSNSSVSSDFSISNSACPQVFDVLMHFCIYLAMFGCAASQATIPDGRF
jgi:hypothetical protein